MKTRLWAIPLVAVGALSPVAMAAQITPIDPDSAGFPQPAPPLESAAPAVTIEPIGKSPPARTAPRPPETSAQEKAGPPARTFAPPSGEVVPASSAEEAALIRQETSAANREVLERGADMDARYQAELARTRAAERRYEADMEIFRAKSAEQKAQAAEYERLQAEWEARYGKHPRK